MKELPGLIESCEYVDLIKMVVNHGTSDVITNTHILFHMFFIFTNVTCTIFQNNSSICFVNIEADRFFGILRPEINMQAIQGKHYNEKDLQNHCRKKMRKLNQKSFPGKYSVFSIRIPRQPDTRNILEFPGIQSTNWVRGRHRDGNLLTFTKH